MSRLIIKTSRGQRVKNLPITSLYGHDNPIPDWMQSHRTLTGHHPLTGHAVTDPEANVRTARDIQRVHQHQEADKNIRDHDEADAELMGGIIETFDLLAATRQDP